MEEQENTQPPTDPLGKEIASLKKRVAAMKKRLQIECSTILSSSPIQTIIQDASASTSHTSSLLKSAPRPAPDAAAAASLQKRSAQQAAYMQQCAYRIAAPVTAFKVRDPDPHAVDRGHVLGLRFEVMSQGHFLRPYYVLLNRPWTDDPSAPSHHLRVHRHTVPPAVPLAGLAARHLPPPPRAATPTTRQDLGRFARALRREIARFHNRLGLTADLRKTVGLARKRSARPPPGAGAGAREVVEAGIADVEAKHVKLAWADGRSGRILMDRDGKVERFVVFGPQGGRDWRMTRMLCDAGDGVDDIARKLQRYAAT